MFSFFRPLPPITRPLSVHRPRSLRQRKLILKALRFHSRMLVFVVLVFPDFKKFVERRFFRVRMNVLVTPMANTQQIIHLMFTALRTALNMVNMVGDTLATSDSGFTTPLRAFQNLFPHLLPLGITPTLRAQRGAFRGCFRP